MQRGSASKPVTPGGSTRNPGIEGGTGLLQIEGMSNIDANKKIVTEFIDGLFM